MKGLILKDLLILKNLMRNILFAMLAFVLLSVMMKNYYYAGFIIPFYIVMLIISVFSNDELNNSNGYIITLPFSRKTIVKARYILSLINIGIALLIGLLLSLIIPLLNSDITFMSIFLSMCATVGGVIIVISLLIPFFYKFGVQKGRMMLFIVIIGLSLVIGTVFALFENAKLPIANFINNIASLHYLIIIVGIILLILFVLYISYRISCKVYQKKEF